MATIFFDYDGTLHNSMAIYGPSFRAAYAWLVEEGHCPEREFDDVWISQWLGWTAEAMWTTFAPDLPSEVWHRAADVVGEHMDALTEQGKARLFEGIPEMLDELKDKGYELAFLSNCRSAYCSVHRSQFGLDRWFDAYYCAEDFNDIPKWQIYQKVCDRHSGPQVMVGDRFHDLDVATRAGIPSVGCAYGFGREGELDAASVVAGSPLEIPDLIEKLLRSQA